MKKAPMRRLLVVVGVVSAFALTAGAANAEVTVNERQPIAVSIFIGCANGGAGEFVQLSGDLHVLLSFQINGNNVSGKSHFQPQGVSGIGLATGDRYRGTGVTQGHFSGSLENSRFASTFVNNFRIIGTGPGNNFLVHSNFHITINADGQLTSFADNFRAECK